MKPSDIFGIVVQTVGLLIAAVALQTLGYAIVSLLGGGPGSVASLLILGIPELLIVLWLLRGARPLVRFAFPEER